MPDPSLPPPPDTDSPVQDVPRTAKEKILGTVGGVLSAGSGRGVQNSPLFQKMEDDHKKRLNLAQYHQKQWATARQVIITGVDPQTGKPLTAEEAERWQQVMEKEQSEYEKAAGTSKDTKDIVKKHVGLVDHIGKIFKQGAGAAAAGTGLPAPPATKPPDAGGLPSPPSTNQTTGPSPPSDLERGAMTHQAGQAQEDQRALDFYKKKKAIDTQEAVAVQNAKNAAKQGTTPRPVRIDPVGVRDAKTLQQKTGKIFLDENWEPIDLENIPENMALRGVLAKNQETNQWGIIYQPFNPAESTTVANNQVIVSSPYDKSKIPQGAGTSIGTRSVPVTTEREVPAVDAQGNPVTQTFKTKRTPQTGAGGLAAPPQASTSTSPTSNTSTTPSARPTSPGGGPQSGRSINMPTAMYNAQLQRITPVREASAQLFGDPANPSMKSMKDFASLADSDESKERMGKALNFIFDEVEAQEKAHGTLTNLLLYDTGLKQSLADARAKAMQEVVTDMTSEEQDALDASLATYGAVVGLRSLTKASGAQFSVKAIEREVPLIGISAMNSRQYYDKLAHIAEITRNGAVGIANQMYQPGEKEYILNQSKEFMKLKNEGVKFPPPPKTSVETPGVVEWKRDASGKPVPAHP